MEVGFSVCLSGVSLLRLEQFVVVPEEGDLKMRLVVAWSWRMVMRQRSIDREDHKGWIDRCVYIWI